MAVHELTQAAKTKVFNQDGLVYCRQCQREHRPFARYMPSREYICKLCFAKDNPEAIEAPKVTATNAPEWVFQMMQKLGRPVKSQELKRMAPFSESAIAMALYHMRKSKVAKLNNGLWSLTGKKRSRSNPEAKRLALKDEIFMLINRPMNTAEIREVVNKFLGKTYCEKYVYELVREMVADGRVDVKKRNQRNQKGSKHLYFRKEEEGVA